MPELGVRKSAERRGGRKSRLSDQGTSMMYVNAFDHSKRKHVSILDIRNTCTVALPASFQNATRSATGSPGD